MREQEIIRIQSGGHPEKALFDICLKVCRGKVHGLIFENVLEEHYLFEILQGRRCFTSGRIYISEAAVSLTLAQTSFAQTIFFPAITVKSARELTVMDAFFIQPPTKNCRYKNTRRLRKQIETMMAVFSVSWTPNMRLRDMNPLQLVELELVKAFCQGYRVIILKNLTALLNSKDITKAVMLFQELRQRGIAFLMVDYDQRFLLKLADDLAIIGNGRTAFQFVREEFDPKLIQKVLLRKQRTDEAASTLKGQVFTEEVLQFANVTAASMPPVNFRIHQGECLVLLDHDGYYGDEIIAMLQGERHHYHGQIYLKGQPFTPRNPRDAVRQGVCVIQENPTAGGRNLFHNMSGLKNLSIMTSGKIRNPFLTERQERSIQKELGHIFTKEQLESQVAVLDPLIRLKLVYYKYFIYYPHLVICVKPLSGSDVRMKEFTEQMISQYLERGIAVLIITTNISEAYSFFGKVLSIQDQKTENPPCLPKNRQL